jgi:putative hydrolases of HD superfamily
MNALPSFPLPVQESEAILFLTRAEGLKNIQRLTRVVDGTRQENTAEHSWQAALFALHLASWSNAPIDVSKVVHMLLVHDLVEVYAGDTDAFDSKATQSQSERELQAAGQMFSGDSQLIQSSRGLWDEFDNGSSAEAKFAKAIDQFLPLFLNMVHHGNAWTHVGIRRQEYLDKKRAIQIGSQKLWEYTLQLVEYSVAQGWLVGEGK